MVYKLIQYILRIYLPAFFKKIEVRGIDNLPKDKPLIFAVNHQNALMDGILVALKLKKPIYFLTRSDVFKGKWIIQIFKLLNLVPIFRSQDGFEDITKKNKETFKYCIEELEKAKQVLIFPEGISEPIHHLFNLKKGVARLALEAESKNDFNLNLYVVPVAINYENHFIGGKKVFVNYSEPIKISEYKNMYQESESKARAKLLRDIKSSLKRNMIHVYGDYARFKEMYWKGIIHKYKSDKEIIAAVKSIPKEAVQFTTKGRNWRKEKYTYNRHRPVQIRVFYFFVCLPGFILFSPTILLTKLLLCKVKDESFYLSVTSLGWLLFGIIQSVISLAYLYGNSSWSIFFLSLIGLVLIAYITLRNFYKPIKGE